MDKKSKSKVDGELKDVAGSTQSGTPSSNEEKMQNTSATLESSQTRPQNQIGFQPTRPLGESEETTNARLVVTFAAKLGALVAWKRLELADGREVFALCFPTNLWTTNAQGELVPKKASQE